MEKTEFEQKFLKLINESNTVITAPNIAYSLDIPIDEAQEHLLSLELNGTLTQSTDDKGNAHYLMPNRPSPGALVAVNRDEPEGNDAQPRSKAAPGLVNPADIPSAPVYSGAGTAPVKGKNVNGLVLNVAVPGLGSIVCGRPIGFVIMGVLLAAIMMLFFLPGWSKLWALLPTAISWIWSIVAGVGLLNEREHGPGVPN
jgi:hypothetical protein